MSTALNVAEIAKSGVADAPLAGTRRESKAGEGHISVALAESEDASITKERYEDSPTEEELHGAAALRRISGKIPWTAWTIAFVELCERFSYYGKPLFANINFQFADRSQVPQLFLSISFSVLCQTDRQLVPVAIMVNLVP